MSNQLDRSDKIDELVQVVLAQIIPGMDNVNIQNNAGDTPLHCAARTSDERMIAALLPIMDLTIKNNKGQTPRDAAIAAGRPMEIITLFDLAEHQRAGDIGQSERPRTIG